MTIRVTETRFVGLAIRTYRHEWRVGVPGPHGTVRKPFKDTWTRFVATDTDSDVGPSFVTRDEAFSALPQYAEEHGYKTA